ncbi:MAG: hypothetical protein NZM25_11830 [Leptospiraceae bacterium]|nr:hypothetical protein [Leptospiraceae bacterium]MDW8307372.1 flagellar hook capping FlgD N-terminal domain-containing protein [Leptospiraceae bacterium]
MPEVFSGVRPTSVAEIEARHKNPTKVKIAPKANDHLDKNAFLKLLVTQLAKQDPLSPVNDREFISQMAHFSSLEQMSEVARSMKEVRSFQANFLLGREVLGRDFVTGRELQGRVEKVFYDSAGQVFLKVGRGSIRFEDVSVIGEYVSHETLRQTTPAPQNPISIGESQEKTPISDIKAHSTQNQTYREGGKLP